MPNDSFYSVFQRMHFMRIPGKYGDVYFCFSSKQHVSSSFSYCHCLHRTGQVAYGFLSTEEVVVEVGISVAGTAVHWNFAVTKLECIIRNYTVKNCDK